MVDLLPPRVRKKVYPVGRLDYNSEGLLLLTNDGEFANKLLSAKAQVPKTYQVKVTGALSKGQLNKFRSGIALDGRKTAPASPSIPVPRSITKHTTNLFGKYVTIVQFAFISQANDQLIYRQVNILRRSCDLNNLLLFL